MDWVLLVVSVAALAVFGRGMALRWPGRADSDRIERVVAAAVWGTGGAIALGWLLSIPMWVRPWPLAGGSVVLGAIGVALARRAGRASFDASRGADSPAARSSGAAGRDARGSRWVWVLVGLWMAFAMGRSLVRFDVNWDSMTRHMVKVAMVVQAGGIRPFDTPQSPVATYPFNATVLQGWPVFFTGVIRLSPWAQTLAWGVCALACAALTRRLWPQTHWGPAAAGAAMFATLALLESATTQDDLIFAMYFLAGALFVVRYFRTGSMRDVPIAAASLVLLACAKLHGPLWAVLLGVAWLVAWAARGAVRRHLGLGIALIVLLFPLLGGWIYVWNWRYHGGPLVVERGGDVLTASQFNPGWSNFAAGLRLLPERLYVDPFVMPRMTYFSHDKSNFGFAMIALVPVFLAGLALDARALSRRERRAEALPRAVFGAVVLLGVLAFMFVHPFTIITFRLMLFFPACVAALALPRLAGWLPRRRRVAVGVVAAVVLIGAGQAVGAAVWDRALPLRMLYTRLPYATRLMYPTPMWPGADTIDLLASPTATVAVAADYDTWTFPLYGPDLARCVIYVRSPDDLDRLPDDTQFFLYHLKMYPDPLLEQAALMHPRLREVGSVPSQRLFVVTPHGPLTSAQSADVQRRVDEASRTFAGVVERVLPGDAESMKSVAQVFAQSGQEKKAEAYLEAVRKIEPDSPDVLDALGVLRAGRGDTTGARALYERALAIDPAHASARTNYGNLLASLGRLPDAIGQFELALRSDPEHAVANGNLGIALLLQSPANRDRAIACFRRAIRSAPLHLSARMMLASALRDAGRANEAIDVLDETVRLFPTDVTSRVELARSLAAAGRADAGRRTLIDGARLNARDARTARAFVWVLATSSTDALRDGEEAVRLAESLRTAYAGASDAATLDVIAAAYAEAGRFDGAVSTAEQALAAAGDDASLRHGIASRLELYRQRRAYRESGS